MNVTDAQLIQPLDQRIASSAFVDDVPAIRQLFVNILVFVNMDYVCLRFIWPKIEFVDSLNIEPD